MSCFIEYLVFNDSIVFRIKLYRLFDVIAPATRFLSHRMPPVNHFFRMTIIAVICVTRFR